MPNLTYLCELRTFQELTVKTKIKKIACHIFFLIFFFLIGFGFLTYLHFFKLFCNSSSKSSVYYTGIACITSLNAAMLLLGFSLYLLLYWLITLKTGHIMHLCISYFYDSSTSNCRQFFFCHIAIRGRAGQHCYFVLEPMGLRHLKSKEI